jgi:hypothetical protein
MSTWEEAAARAFDASLPTGVVPPPVDERQRAIDRAIATAPPEADDAPAEHAPRPPLIVVDHFNLNMIDMSADGACLLVQQLTRSEAMSLVRKHNPPIVTFNERDLGDLEKDLQLDPLPRPNLRYGTRLLVRSAPRWNDVRWFLVEYSADGNGVCP